MRPPYLSPRSTSLKHFLLLKVLLPSLMCSTGTATDSTPVATDLARDDRALQRVIVGVGASEATKTTATELADYLGRIKGSGKAPG